MKIHIIQPALPTYRSTLFKKIQEHIAERGYTLVVHTTLHDHLGVDSVEANGFKCIFDGRIYSFFNKKLLWQTNLFFKIEKNDILVLDGNPRWLNNYILFIYSKILGFKLVWWGQGWSAKSRGNRSKIRQFIMRFFKYIILYTEAEKNEYIKLGFNKNNTYALNNGLDLDCIEDSINYWSCHRLEKFKANIKFDSNKFWIIFIGRLTYKSEINILIKSLIFTNPQICLIVIGDGPLKNQSTSLAKSLGLESRIIWAGQFFNETDITPWMLLSNIFVYPGSVGLSLIHAFSYGLPAIISEDKNHHMPEVAAFINEYNGRSFENGSVTSLASTINSIYENSYVLKKMSLNAKLTVKDTFNIIDMTNRFVTALKLNK